MTKRRYLVTGTDMGLGFALTEAVLKQNDTVFSCTYKPASDKMLALKEQYPDDLFIVEGVDIGSDESVAKAVAEVSGHTDKLDVIINNGAINPDNFKSKLSVCPD